MKENIKPLLFRNGLIQSLFLMSHTLFTIRPGEPGSRVRDVIQIIKVSKILEFFHEGGRKHKKKGFEFGF